MSSSSITSARESTYLLLGTRAKSYHNFKYGEALVHLIKGYIGTGIFSMGDAFKHSGLIMGFICVFGVGLLCLHCCHLLVNTSRTLYEKHQLKTVPGYAEAAELCFSLGFPNLRFAGKIAKITVNVFLVMGQMGFCACYLVFISRNIQEFLKVYQTSLDIHWSIVIVVFPIWLTCLIRTLKLLFPLSIIANLILVASIVIVIYYAFCLPINDNQAKLEPPGVARFLIFLGQTVFAFEGVGLVLILYGEMKERETFQGTFGVLNSGLVIVTALYSFFGAITYLQFGEEIKDTVTLNLMTTEKLAQTVLVLICIGVSFSFSLQLYVAVDILWPEIMKKLGTINHPVVGELIFRTSLVALIFTMSEAIPNLEILLSFVGSFVSVALIILFPAIMDLTTFYSVHEVTVYIFMKDTLLILLGILAMGAGTFESISLLTE